MRNIRHISYSSKSLFYSDRDAYVINYLCDVRPPRDPSTKYMIVGSAFDAFVKSKLSEDLFGHGAKPEYELTSLFESQVELEFRDEAFKVGQYILDQYTESGFYRSLLELMEGAQEEPRFEFDLGDKVEGIPIFGKPDCYFINRDWIPVLLDWKVKGFYAKKSPSPTKYYKLCSDGPNWPKASRTNGKSHPKFINTDYLGCNKLYLEESSEMYADQLSMYSWMVGRPVGDETTVCCIDEAIAKPVEGGYPLFRFTQQRARVSSEYQKALMKSLQIMWEAVNSGHVYFEVSKDENDVRIAQIQDRSLGMVRCLGNRKERHG